MVYTESQSAINGSLNNGSLLPRGFVGGYRPITNCYDSFFVESHCTPQNDRPGTLQSYSITCAHYVDHHDPFSGLYQQSHVVHRHRGGFCDSDEICMNGLGGVFVYPRLRQYANCVKRSMFDGTMYGPGEGESKQRINRVLEKGGYQGAYMVMSDSDGTTPTEVDTFNIDAWPEIGSKQSEKCRDCMNLQTDAVKSDIKALKAQARLLTAGAAAGILWLGLMSG